jgi:cation diffusion facilitator family transporter
MQDIKERVALSSIAASAGLTAAKAVVGVLSGSLGILSEAGHSLVDLGATILTYFAIRIAGKPADAEHHYGHGKVESLAALAATALLFLLSGIVIWEAVQRLFGHETAGVEASVWAFGVVIVSIIVDFFRARVLYRVARTSSSEALEADALHFSSDMWSSFAVLIGLVGVAFGYQWADSVAAIIVAIFICIAGWRLGRHTIDSLTDVAPAGSAERISRIALRVRRVVDVERVRVRAVGKRLFVDLVVAVSRTLPLDQASAVKDEIARAIAAEIPEAEATVTTVPRALDNETVLERVMLIARNLTMAVHHITVHAIEGRLAISLDLEVDGELSLGAAHDIASSLETAVREELGPTVEVETHIEPLEPGGLLGRDADPARIEEVRAALETLARELGSIGDVHDVRVRETGEGEIVNFHCWVDPAMTVHAVHEQVDEVERALRRRWPSIKRVIGHAEPRPPQKAAASA